MSLKDKVAIITGAGQGIGEAFALGFAREGAKIVVADINAANAEKVAAEIRKNKGAALAIHVDVSSESDTMAMAQKTIDAFGKIDILVNNAAIFSGLKLKPFNAWTVDEWDRIFAVNVKGMWLCSNAVVPRMAKQGKGKIVNVSSVTFQLGFTHFLPYVATKGAVVAITRSLARELGDQGINVNSIAPGLTMSEATKKLTSEHHGMAEAVVSNQCIKRCEEPKDLVGVAVFLSSEKADFITGQNLLVDGGLVLQ